MSQDISVLSQNMPSGGPDGVPGLVQFFQSGTADLKKMLTTECDVIYECRYCRSMFRSIINFTTHKRQYCKGKFAAVVANSSTLWEQYLAKVEKKDLNEDETEKPKATNNMMKIIKKATEDVTVPVPGSNESLVLATLPRPSRRIEDKDKRIVGLAATEAGMDEAARAETRIMVTATEDPNIRNKSARLMGRRADKDAILTRYSATLLPNELAALHKIVSLNPDCIDGLSVKCHHPGCANVRPFKNFSVFAYHCGMKHSSRGKGQKLTCYLCNHTIKQWSNYFQHYARVHKNVKEQHEKDRAEDKETPSPKKGHRVRSLSPNRDAVAKEEKEEEANENEGESLPPVIQPIDINDSGMADCDDNDDDEPPTLVRMGRTRSRNVRNGPVGGTPVRSTRQVSRPPTPYTPDESQEAEKQQKKLEEQERKANKKLTQDVKRVVEQLVKQVLEEEDGEEKMDVSGVRLYGKKAKLRGRACYNAKCEVLMKMAAREGSLPPMIKKSEKANKEEVKKEQKHEEGQNKLEEMGEEPKSRKRKVDETSQETTPEKEPDVGSSRPSRAKKRPDWMESYLLEEKKPTIKEETPAPQKDSSVPPMSTRPVLPVKSKNTPPRTIPRIRIKPIKKPETPSPPPEDDREDSVYPLSDCTASEASVEPSPMPSPGSSRRKQDMSIARDTSEGAILTYKDGKQGHLPPDLASIPIYLSNQQKAIIFSGLTPVNPQPDYTVSCDQQQPGGYICKYCHEKIESVRDGRRHMVAHIRVIRLRCKLCGSGAFFLTDLRAHLMDKGCPNLHKAGIPVKDTIPCMSRLQADSLCEVVDTLSPGRVQYSSDKIVSVLNKEPHTPNLEIEEKILGPDRGKEFLAPSKRHSRRTL